MKKRIALVAATLALLSQTAFAWDLGYWHGTGNSAFHEFMHYLSHLFGG